MDNVSRQRLDSILAVVHLDINSRIKCKIFPEEQIKLGNEIIIRSSINSADPEPSYHPMKTFFDFGYYSLSLPFRFVKDEFLQYQLKTSSAKKVISFIMFISTLLYYFTTARIRLSHSQTQKSPVITYFYVVHSIFHFAMIICYYDAIFRRSDGFLKLMRELGSATLIHSNSMKIRNASYIIHIVYIVGTVLLQVLDYPIGSTDQSIGRGIMRFSIQLARYTFFIDNNPNVTSSIYLGSITDENWTAMDYSLGILEIVIGASYTLVNSFFTAACFHSPVSLWIAIKRFFNEVLPQNSYDDEEDESSLRLMQTRSDARSARIIGNTIAHKFNELQKLSSLFNHVWGTFYFVAILDYIVWSATDLDVGLKAKDWLTRISSAWRLGTIMMLLFFSSECARMMSRFRTWLVKDGKHYFMDENELSDLINLVDTKIVGVGIDGLYKIDYPFTGQITTIIITIFIITLQYDRNADHLA